MSQRTSTLQYARLWTCTSCRTVVATNAELGQRPEVELEDGECPSCGHDGFTGCQLAGSEEEARQKARAARERRRAER